MKRKPDYEGEILKLGWNTESTSSGRMMAERGGMKTGWHDSWQKVLAEISGDVESAKLANDPSSATARTGAVSGKETTE